MKNGIIDNIDRQILMILQENGRISNADIARAVSMAPSAVLERVRKLEKESVIQGYEARLHPKKVNRGLTAFIFVRTDEAVGATGVGEDLARVEEVLEVHYTAGRDNYLVKARVPDPDGLKVLLGRFGEIAGVRDTHSIIVLTTVKETNSVSLDSIEENGGNGR